MEVSRRQDRRWSVAAAALGALALTAALLLGSPTPGSAAAGTTCAHAGDHPGEATRRQLRRAVACLINQRRENRGKPKLDRNGKLGGVATSHAETMVAQDCFEHKCDGEPGFERRVRQSGYSDGADRWKAREHLGCAPTPRAMVRAFMRKDSSRLNLLNERFRDIGVGARRGSPTTAGETKCQPEADFVTYDVILAWRRR